MWPLTSCEGQGEGEATDDTHIVPKPPGDGRQMLWEEFLHKEKSASVTVRIHSHTSSQGVEG